MEVRGSRTSHYQRVFERTKATSVDVSKDSEVGEAPSEPGPHPNHLVPVLQAL